MAKFHFPKLDFEEALRRGSTFRERALRAIKGLPFLRNVRWLFEEVKNRWRLQAGLLLTAICLLLGCFVVWQIYSALTPAPAKRPVPVKVKQAEVLPVPKVESRPKAEFVPLMLPVMVAIILDDAGGNCVPYSEIFSIDAPLTISVLPNMAGSAGTVNKAKAAGKEAILHLPMEPHNGGYVRHDGTMVLTEMSDEAIREVVIKDLATVTGVVGVNNHMGSKATEDKRVMDIVLAAIKEKGLFFVDSRTSRNSVAYDRAKASGVKSAKNVIFLDVFPGEGAVEKRIGDLVEIAKKNGGAIGIGHATRINTVTALKRMIPEYKKHGVKFVFASALVK